MFHLFFKEDLCSEIAPVDDWQSHGLRREESYLDNMCWCHPLYCHD